MDTVEATNTLIQERHSHSESCIIVKMSRRTQKADIYLANEGSGFAFFSTDLEYFFGNNVGNEFGVLMKEKGPYKPEFAYDIVGIHSLMIYTDLIECYFVGHKKVLLLRCFLFLSKLKDGHIIATRQ